MKEEPTRREFLVQAGELAAKAVLAAGGVGAAITETSAQEGLSNIEGFTWIKMPAGTEFTLGIHGVVTSAHEADRTRKYSFPDGKVLTLSQSPVLPAQDRVKEATFKQIGRSSDGAFLELTVVRGNGKSEVYWIVSNKKADVGALSATFKLMERK